MRKFIPMFMIMLILISTLSIITVSATPPILSYPTYNHPNVNLATYPYKIIFKGTGNNNLYHHNERTQVIYSTMPLKVYKNTYNEYAIMHRAVNYTAPDNKPGYVRRYYASSVDGYTAWRIGVLGTDGYDETDVTYNNLYTMIGEGALVIEAQDIYYSNHDIGFVDQLGNDLPGTFVNTSMANTNTPTITLLSPADGSEVSNPLQRFTASYRWVPPMKDGGGFYTKAEINALFDIKVSGGWASSTLRWIGNDGTFASNVLTGTISWEQKLAPGENTITVDFYNEMSNQLLASDTATITMVTDFVDTNTDGLDDRTGEPEYIPPTVDEDWDGTVNTGNWISQAISNMNNWVQSNASWIRNVSAFFNAIFSFLPEEVRGAFTVLITVIVFFTVMKVIRG
jgi:hypothetical protein